MPRYSGSDTNTISRNIRMLVREGYPVKQAIAIAYREARKPKKKAKKR